jgi:fatty acid desaturase
MATNDNYDPDKEREQHEAAVGAGTGAAMGLGCLGVALMPWTFMILVFAILAIAWFFFKGHNGG